MNMKNRIAYVDQRPHRFVHDCDECEYLGQRGEYDLWACVRRNDPHGGTLIARWSDDGPDYYSGTVFAVAALLSGDTDYPLVEAFRRMWKLDRVKVTLVPSRETAAEERAEKQTEIARAVMATAEELGAKLAAAEADRDAERKAHAENLAALSDRISLLGRCERAEADRDRLREDVAFLVPRARRMGEWYADEERDFGASANNLVNVAYGGKDAGNRPYDIWDMRACERAWAKLPVHRMTEEVRLLLVDCRRALAASEGGKP